MTTFTIAAAWATGLVGMLVLGAGLSLATLAAATAFARSPAGASSMGWRGLRRIYGAVLWVTCIYFYASVALALAGLTALGIWMARSTIEDAAYLKPRYHDADVWAVIWVLFIIVGFVALVVRLARSLWRGLVRPPESEGELRVGAGEHPELLRLVRTVAADLGTEAVDAVYLVPDSTIAAFERGGLAQQLTGKAERCLVLGIAALEGLSQGELKAILAHEYGHFLNRDTAGGRLALAVRRSLSDMARALIERGAATWYNPAWWSLLAFRLAFLRISQGASRLQEILADRWAASVYGGAVCSRALATTLGRAIRFDHHAQRTIQEVVDRRQALPNLYQYPLAVRPDDARALEAAVTAAMDAETAYDSHPSARKRITWVQDVPGARPPADDDAAPAWALFADREEVERAMTARIRETVAGEYGVMIPGPGGRSRRSSAA